MTFVPESFDTGVDPHFYFMQYSGERLPDRLDVIATITDENMWKGLADKGVISRSWFPVKDKKEWIVTAELPTERFVEISGLPFVRQLKVAQRVYPIA